MSQTSSTPITEATRVRPLAVGNYTCTVTRRADGSCLFQPNEALGDYPDRYTERLIYWAERQSQQTFLAERNSKGNWRTLSYEQVYRQVRQLAGTLLNRGLNAERPLVILSENSLEHALLALAAMHVGIPYSPISPAYSLLSKSGERVRHALQLLTPGLVFVQDTQRYAHALTFVPENTEVVFVHGPEGGPGTSFEALQQEASDPARTQAAHLAVGRDTIAKFLFTSGSTKLPKAVINTHGMLTSNQQMFLQCYPFLANDPPVLVDWLPWHHTAGGNHCFGKVLYNGGSLYIDNGKPTPELITTTIANLKDIAPTVYYTVPKGLEALLRAMQDDEALRTHFFSRLRNIFPVGAAIAGPLKQAIDDLGVATTGERIPMTVSLGMTETAPFALSTHFLNWQPGNIGIPAPGQELKLAPVGDKLEVRYRGPNITPGYWRQPELAPEAYDEEGFFCSGDGALFLDNDNPSAGLLFNGRIAEDFKLDSGTWVNVGDLRMRVITAGAPYIHDAVITGRDRSELGMLVFLHPTALSALENPQAWLAQLLKTLATQASGSSQLITRAMIQTQPASLDLGEATDKGSINQRRVLETRHELVAALYADETPPDVARLS